MNILQEREYSEGLCLRLTKIDNEDIGIITYFTDRNIITMEEGLLLQLNLSFPNKPVHGHSINIALRNIELFLDRENIERIAINDIKYDHLECSICMSGPEESLIRHIDTEGIYFHEDCYKDVSEKIEEFIDENRGEMAAFQI